jgi:hypothetical protein
MNKSGVGTKETLHLPDRSGFGRRRLSSDGVAIKAARNPPDLSLEEKPSAEVHITIKRPACAAETIQ